MIDNYESEWSITILLLHEYEIYYKLEDFAKKEKLIDDSEKITDTTYENLCKCIRKYFEENEIEKFKKFELLSFCLF